MSIEYEDFNKEEKEVYNELLDKYWKSVTPKSEKQKNALTFLTSIAIYNSNPNNDDCIY